MMNFLKSLLVVACLSVAVSSYTLHLTNPDRVEVRDYPTPKPGTTTTKTPWTGPPKPTCNKANEGKYFPEPTNCNEYWRCTNDHVYLEICPTTLVWNAKLGYCDYKDHTDTSHCVLKFSATPMDTPTCTTPHEGDFYPYPQDCHKYYRCTDQISVLEDCKGVLVWNTLKDTCDYPYRTDTSHCAM